MKAAAKAVEETRGRAAVGTTTARTGEVPVERAGDASTEKVVEKIARTCLYEGYLLWPYRRSALKNRRRWTFGGVFPASNAALLGEPARMSTQVLLETGPDTTVTVRVRFLHLVDRRVHREGPDGPEPLEELTVGDRRYLSWQETTEREVVLPAWKPDAGRPYRTAVDISAGRDDEPLLDPAGRRAGTIVRGWQRLTGRVDIAAVPVADGTLRLTVGIDNTTACLPPPPGTPVTRDAAAAYAFLSTHTVLHAQNGDFVSLTDPPDHLTEAAAGCRNTGTWPVLVGDDDPAPPADPRRSRTVLSSPITLYDFPVIAPQSPGDLFDGCEIDQLLVLSVLSMTEEEQEEARACDPRAREILDRCAALTPQDLMDLHGGRTRNHRPRDGA